MTWENFSCSKMKAHSVVTSFNSFYLCVRPDEYLEFNSNSVPQDDEVVCNIVPLFH